MNKKTDKKVGKFLLGLSICSVIITFLEGIMFYSAEQYPNAFLRSMLIIQNTIRAFGFKSDIGIKDVAKMLQNSTSSIEIVLNYAYSVAIFTAPYCTVVFLYKVLKKLFQIRSWKWFGKKDGIIVFGYNNEVKALLNEYSDVIGSKEKSSEKQEAYKKYRIHLVAENVSSEEEMKLLRNNIVVHKVDWLNLSTEQQRYFLSQMEAGQAKCIILFYESSVLNFSLYKMFHNPRNLELLNQNVKFFCRCENEGIRGLLENFHDNESIETDMETISIPELRIRNLLRNTPLHPYYEEKGQKILAQSESDKLHLLIIGFGKLGQQLLLQAMNMGVVSSKNEILIDVVDFKMEEKQGIFANYFNENYVEMKDNRLRISSEKADGNFQVRFHQMDIRYKKFYDVLKDNGSEENGGMYTYVAICIEDEEVGIHCLSEVQKYLSRCSKEGSSNRIPVAVRMEMDRYMADYLNSNDKTYKNVVAIQEGREVLSFEELIHDKLNQDAKEFNWIYNNIKILDEKEQKKKQTDKTSPESAWRKLVLFKRDSNRALTEHARVKELIFNRMMLVKSGKAELERCFGENGELLKKNDGAWLYASDLDEFVKRQSDNEAYGFVSEMSRLEHRRWCYFMASRGWCGTDESDEGKKKEILEKEKKNKCLCTWKDLADSADKKGNCPYDLMWLLKKYKEIH